MLAVVKDSWALLLGLLLIMVGNGLQGTLLGVRGAIEGMSAASLSFVMSAYFLGFIFGSRLTPEMIRRVGHVRVFAALASLISAAFILYAAAPYPWAWALMRLVVGICFAGVYVVCESWLNDRATNETRGQAMSAYLIVQMGGAIAAQGLLNFADPSGYALFVLISVLVSISVAPMLLSVGPTPVFASTSRLSLLELFRASPLSAVGMVLMGLVYSTMLGMSAVYGAKAGLTLAQISAFVGAIYFGGLILQWPIGWLSDRMDRRRLIVATTLLGAAGALLGALASFLGDPGGSLFALVLVSGLLIGGTANPLYALLIAHANDYLPNDKMAAGSSGLVFLNGSGAVGGPLIVGSLMSATDDSVFFLFISVAMAAVALYGLWRMTRRAAVPTAETTPHTAVSPSATVVAVEISTDLALDAQQAQAEAKAEAEAEAEATERA